MARSGPVRVRPLGPAAWRFGALGRGRVRAGHAAVLCGGLLRRPRRRVVERGGARRGIAADRGGGCCSRRRRSGARHDRQRLPGCRRVRAHAGRGTGPGRNDRLRLARAARAVAGSAARLGLGDGCLDGAGGTACAFGQGGGGRAAGDPAELGGLCGRAPSPLCPDRRAAAAGARPAAEISRTGADIAPRCVDAAGHRLLARQPDQDQPVPERRGGVRRGPRRAALPRLPQAVGSLHPARRLAPPW